MLILLFRAYGDDFDASDFVAENSIAIADLWRKGQEFHTGRGLIHRDSGFSISLDGEFGASEAANLVGSFLRENSAWLDALTAHHVTAEFSVGILVGSEGSYASGIELTDAILGELARARVGLSITAYPCSDGTDPS